MKGAVGLIGQQGQQFSTASDIRAPSPWPPLAVGRQCPRTTGRGAGQAPRAGGQAAEGTGHHPAVGGPCSPGPGPARPLPASPAGPASRRVPSASQPIVGRLTGPSLQSRWSETKVHPWAEARDEVAAEHGGNGDNHDRGPLFGQAAHFCSPRLHRRGGWLGGSPISAWKWRSAAR